METHSLEDSATAHTFSFHPQQAVIQAKKHSKYKNIYQQGTAMCVLLVTGPTLFLFEDAQLQCPGGKLSQDHHHKPALKTGQEEHRTCPAGRGKERVNCLRSHRLLHLKEMRRFRSGQGDQKPPGKNSSLINLLLCLQNLPSMAEILEPFA